jgi:P-type Cu+ transporter
MEVIIGVNGMIYGHCQKRVADAIYSLDGVDSIEADLEAKHATVNSNLKKKYLII